MKNFVFLMCAMIMCTFSFAQNATNADGTIKSRGNVAIMVTSHSFTFQDGIFKKQIDDETIITLKSAINAMAMQKFGNSGFGIVNRDNEAYENVKKVMEEQKLEDYINGFSVQAKGEGADCLFLTDITTFSENNFSQTFISCRLINIANNIGLHYSMKTEPINMSNEIKMATEIRQMVNEFGEFLNKHILDAYPEQYAIVKSEGKKIYLAAYQPNGRILESDKFYAFQYTQEALKIGQQSQPVTVLKPLAVATEATAASGYCLVKSDKALQPSNDIVLFRNQQNPKVSAGPMTWTYFALQYKPNTYEGFIMNRVNNAVYDALTRHPGSVIVEQEHLLELKKERELQKTEDFIDGHVVEQMKAIGAQFMIHLENFSINGSQISFKLNAISVEQNKILRTIDVVTSIDNIEDEMYKQICERMAYPCNILSMDKNSINLISGWSLNPGDEFIIQVNKEMKNPITGEISYNRVEVCKCNVIEYNGNKFTAAINEVISEEDFKILPKYSEANSTTICMDGSSIKSSISTESDLEKAIKKQEKKEKRKAFVKSLGKALQESVTITNP